jgi:hypothetical protein
MLEQYKKILLENNARQFYFASSLLNYLVELHNYQTYLEIGVYQCETFNQINIPNKVGVDPNSPADFHVSSDEFFMTNQTSYDLIFIDGEHEQLQLLRDVNNSLTHLNKNGTIVCHDINPTHPDHTMTHILGTAYLAFADLRWTRNDLNLFALDLDWGYGIIRPATEPTTPPPPNLTYTTFEDFNCHRVQLLNLLPIREAIQFL